MAKATKPPACLDADRCPMIAACLDANPCCVAFGSIGSDKPLGIPRKRLMTGVLFAAGLALCLNVFACLAMSTAGGVIRASAWAVGRARRGPGTAYFGLTSAVAYHDDKIIYEESWAHVECSEYALPPDDDAREKPRDDVRKCRNCRRRVEGMKSTVIVSMITTLGTARFAMKRMSPENDRSLFKALGMILGIVAFSTALSPLIAFRADCTTSSTDTLKHMRNGPGFICMAIAVCLKGSSVFAHLALRVSNGDGVVREPSVHPKKSAAKGMARSACPFAPVHIDMEGN